MPGFLETPIERAAAVLRFDGATIGVPLILIDSRQEHIVVSGSLRRLLGGTLGISLAATLLAASPMSAHAEQQAESRSAAVSGRAANPTVKIAKIRGKKVRHGGKAKIRPSYRKVGRVKIQRARLTVRQGTKKVAANRRAVRLGAGTYQVKQVVTYKKGSQVTIRKVFYPAGKRVVGNWLDVHYDVTIYLDCDNSKVMVPGVSAETVCVVERYDARTADSREWRVTVPLTLDNRGYWVSADGGIESRDTSNGHSVGSLDAAWVTPPVALAGNVKKLRWSKKQRAVRKQTLTIKQDPKPRGCATRADFNRVYVDFDGKWGHTEGEVRRILQSPGKSESFSTYRDGWIEFRSYRACARGARISVGFDTGVAYTKSYYG